MSDEHERDRHDEAPRLRLPRPVRARRSQAERTAETRRRIIRAVTESIAEVGFQRTTATEIASRAGVTWGAVQHHFGGKDGILAAVLEDSFARFAERVGELGPDDAPLEKRVALFVDRAWEHFTSPAYRSAFEILLNASGEEERDARPGWQAPLLRAWDRVWRELFADSPIPSARLRRLERYAFAVLTGLATARWLGWRPAGEGESDLVLLKETLVRELGPV
jgi:AcrR family transcriptional regulator